MFGMYQMAICQGVRRATLGAVIFLLDSKINYAHFAWHLFVTFRTGSRPIAALRDTPEPRMHRDEYDRVCQHRLHEQQPAPSKAALLPGAVKGIDIVLAAPGQCGAIVLEVPLRPVVVLGERRLP